MPKPRLCHEEEVTAQSPLRRVKKERFAIKGKLSDEFRIMAGFPVMLGYAKSLDMNLTSFLILVLMNTFGDLRVSDIGRFGIFIDPYKPSHLQKLVELELCEVFGNEQKTTATKTYCVSKKGIKVYREYQTYFYHTIDEFKKDFHHAERIRAWMK